MPTQPNENIKKLDEKIAQLQTRKKALENQEKAKLRKERERRLIKLGEIAEKYNFTPEQLEECLKRFVPMFSKYLKPSPPVEKP
jgi:hypothetical protein